jgi:hypothetical protein
LPLLILDYLSSPSETRMSGLELLYPESRHLQALYSRTLGS